MATEILLPQWGMGMHEGTIVQWLKKEGESVNEGEPLVEVEAEKVTSVVEAVRSGVLLRVLVAEGTSVPVRTTLCLIGAPGEVIPEVETAPTPIETRSEPRPISELSAAQVQITPVARRLAREHGIDLGLVQGTGPRGRITEEDVRRAIESGAISKSQVIPLAGIRSVIAQRMHESLQTMAQVTLITEADVTNLEQLREELKPQFDLTYTDLIVKAVAQALTEHLRLNAWVEGENIRLLRSIHVGVAVALEDGLVVPVVHDADRKSLREIAQESQRLAHHAREGKLTREEVADGTFTVTNLGMYGVDAFTPIINPPEVAILGIGRIFEKPTRGPQEVVWRRMLTLSLTFDHRAVDGAPAAAFLQAICKQLETPASLAG
ncbi:MAG TPA: dihydrolipoamide acetyltransferase family protein [Ktedonobacteraceae bacterium]